MKKKSFGKSILSLIIVFAVILFAFGCSPWVILNDETESGAPPADETDSSGNTIVKVWVHVAESTAEGKAYKQRIDAFNTAYASQSIRAKIEYKPRSNNATSVETMINNAKVNGTLPHILTYDAPNTWSYAKSKIIYPIDNAVSKETKADFMNSSVTQGTYEGKLYGLPIQESSAGIFYNKQIFRDAGVYDRVKDMTVETAWNFTQFKEIALQIKNNTGKLPIDLRIDATSTMDELATYLLTPFIWNTGAELLSSDGLKAAGYLNSTQARNGFQFIKDLVSDGITSYETSPTGFFQKQYAMYLSSGWTIPDIEIQYSANFPNRDAWGLLPYPKGDTGNATSPMGSWCFGSTWEATADSPTALLLEWLVSPESSIAITNATGMIPARLSAIDSQEKFKTEGPERILYQQLLNTGRPRPLTVAYPEFTSTFRDIIKEIKSGDVTAVINSRATNLDLELAKHK